MHRTQSVLNKPNSNSVGFYDWIVLQRSLSGHNSQFFTSFLCFSTVHFAPIRVKSSENYFKSITCIFILIIRYSFSTPFRLRRNCGTVWAGAGHGKMHLPERSHKNNGLGQGHILRQAARASPRKTRISYDSKHIFL